MSINIFNIQLCYFFYAWVKVVITFKQNISSGLVGNYLVSYFSHPRTRTSTFLYLACTCLCRNLLQTLWTRNLAGTTCCHRQLVCSALTPSLFLTCRPCYFLPHRCWAYIWWGNNTPNREFTEFQRLPAGIVILLWWMSEGHHFCLCVRAVFIILLCWRQRFLFVICMNILREMWFTLISSLL